MHQRRDKSGHSKTDKRFADEVVAVFRKSKGLRLRLGSAGHRFVGIWFVLVQHRLAGDFGLGASPDFYPGVQFSRQMVPSTGPYDAQVNTQAVAALFSKIGPGISVTRSPARDQVSGGNRHFLMSDLNKVRIADHLSKFLSGKTVSAIQRVRNIASEFRRFLSAAAARA